MKWSLEEFKRGPESMLVIISNDELGWIKTVGNFIFIEGEEGELAEWKTELELIMTRMNQKE